MKISISTIGVGTIGQTECQGHRMYVGLAPATIRKRHDVQLTLKNGWVHLDYDEQGFLVGLELVEGDPFEKPNRKNIDILQPKDPLNP